MNRKILLIFLSLSCFYSFAEESLPIKVHSNSLRVNYSKNIAKYYGEVLAAQGDLNINSDVMTVFYKKGSSSLRGKGANFESISFDHNVKIEQGGNIATGDNAIYVEKDKKVFLTGNVILMQDKNRLIGKTVIYDTDKKFFSITNGKDKAKQRVRAIIFD